MLYHESGSTVLQSFPTIGADLINWIIEKFVIFGRSQFRRVLCRLIAAAMLFAQAISVAQACIEVTQSPTMAFADATHEGDCDKTVNKNACLQQYTAGDQSTAQIQIAVAEMPELPALIVPVELDSGTVPAGPVFCLTRSSAPPPSIRFCSFQL